MTSDANSGRRLKDPTMRTSDHTSPAKTYWEGNGELQAEYKVLFKRLVPATGNAPTEDGQALRAISRIYYDLYNNGGGNLVDFDDEGNWVEVTRETEEMLRCIQRVCPDVTDSDRRILENMICNDEGIITAQMWEELERITTNVIRAVVLRRLDTQ